MTQAASKARARPAAQERGDPTALPSATPIAAPRAEDWASAMSTKMTPRRTTCKPNVTWAPISTMHMAIGAAMNRMNSMTISLCGRAEEAGHDDIHERDVGVRSVHPAHRRGKKGRL